jgi:hypothetical protein
LGTEVPGTFAPDGLIQEVTIFLQKYLLVSKIICNFAPIKNKTINEETVITDHFYLLEHFGLCPGTEGSGGNTSEGRDA